MILAAQSAFSLNHAQPALRLQTHRGDKVPLGLYKDVSCTLPATVAGDTVAAWRDELSGNGIVASQSDAAKRPLLQFDSGSPVLAFDGNKALDGVLLVPGNSLVIVAKTTNGNNGAVYTDSNNGTHQPFGNGFAYENFAAASRIEAIDVAGALYTWFVYRAEVVSGTFALRVNGQLKRSEAVAAASRLPFRIGSSHLTVTAYVGLVQHVVVCQAANASKVEQYFLAQLGL